MPVEKRRFDRLTEQIRNFCALLIVTLTIISAVVATAWALYGVPDIEKRIETRASKIENTAECRYRTIQKSLDYISIQQRTSMSSHDVAKADSLYFQMIRQRGETP